MADTRIKEYDFTKGILIILVIWGHCCSYLSGFDYEKNLFTTYVRLFQMPLFILISGYFTNPTLCFSDLLAKTQKAIVRIGLPYMCWTLVSYGIVLLIERIGGGGNL